ncbi:hypothetical protein [Puniceibacterium sp. IMCC21224]|uniref:hypothetical protein n=1 Tax=Puniceibacterium sp. IMCC21224 TaxID=1618204 RepID=UPI00064D7B32|nr:hypothetical protein [Puniceibacterium sp. IMCC21224]
MALPRTATERVQVFATCVGRLSAVMEFQWMFDGPASERTQKVRRGVEALLDAVLPQALAGGLSGVQALDWRIRAKVAQAALLQQATFGTDPRRMRMAQRAAEMYQGECESMLLG